MRVYVRRCTSRALANTFTELTFTCYYKLHYRAYKSRFYSSNVKPSSSTTWQPAALSSRIAAGKLVS